MNRIINAYKNTRVLELGNLSNVGLGIENDNNVDKLVFKFDEMVDGIPSLLTNIKGSDGLLLPFSLTKNENSYELLITKELLVNEELTIELMIVNSEGEQVWHSKQATLFVSRSLEVGTGEMPSVVENWLASANLQLDLIEQKEQFRIQNEEVRQEQEQQRMNNEQERQSNEDVRVENEVSREDYINQLKQDVEDGKFKGEKGDKGDTGEKGDRGEKGDAGQVKFIIVDSLPIIGDEEAIYLVPSKEQQEQNMYDEFIYTNGKWEQLGSTPIEVDLDDYYTKEETNTKLDDYVKNTDYATSTKGGTTKTSYNKNFDIYNGLPFAVVNTYAQYQNKDNDSFIGKGTLENVIAGKELVNKTYVGDEIDSIKTSNIYDASEVVNGIIVGTVGNEVTVNSSTRTKVYKNVCKVQKGNEYTIEFNPNTPSAIGNRDCVIVDENLKILAKFKLVISETTNQLTFTAHENGILWLGLDTNATDVQIFENWDGTTLMSLSNKIDEQIGNIDTLLIELNTGGGVE